MTSEPLFRWFSQLALPRQSFVGYSGQMVEPKYLCFLSSAEKWFHIQGSASFTAAHIVAKCHTMGDSSKIPSLQLAPEIILFRSLPKIQDHS